MSRRQLVAAIVAVTLVLACAVPGVALAKNPAHAHVLNLSGTITSGTPVPILANPLSPLRAAMVGESGTWAGHVVLTPRLAPPPAVSDGYQENSRFTVKGFLGTVVVEGPVALGLFGETPHVLLMTTQPTNMSLQVHFGTQPSKPVLTLMCNPPVLYFPTAGQPGVSVRFIHIVGLKVVASH